METLYDLLGALPNDDVDDLRAAFRRAVKRAHPDVNPEDPDVGLKFRRREGSPVEIVISLFCFSGAQARMSESHHRSCQCGAVYSRTEAMAPERQIASFEWSLCDTTLETWNTAWVPTYQFLAGPVRLPNSGTNS